MIPQREGRLRPSGHGGLSRREFLARAGWASLGAALLQLPGVLKGRGWLDEAAAQSADLTLDTLNGFVAFVVPGPDPYSVAQGQSSPTPGGVAAKAGEQMAVLLDAFVAAPDLGPFTNDDNAPASDAAASLLNAVAAKVDPVAAGGPFPSHFSRLSFAKKVEVFRQLDGTEGEDDGARTIRFVAAALPAFGVLCTFNEWHAFDPQTRTLRERPIGWNLANYYPGRTGPSDGWPEFRGYYKGRKRARTGRRKGKS